MSNRDFVTVVSGLPRSGTSMMMKALEAGGIGIMADGERKPNEDNPNGYYEYERVKDLPGDVAWLPEARNKVVKIIYKLVYELPANERYKIIFMQRDVEEVVASQEKMLVRSGQNPADVPRDVIANLFQSDVMSFRSWVSTKPHIAMHVVDYSNFINEPLGQALGIAEFLNRPLDTNAMAEVVDPKLYRNRVT